MLGTGHELSIDIVHTRLLPPRGLSLQKTIPGHGWDPSPRTARSCQCATAALIASVSAGISLACGLTTSGEAYCWGSNFGGGLGNGLVGDAQPTPGPVRGGLTFASIHTGSDHVCGVTTGSVAYCWGNNFNAQLGDSTRIDRTEPSAVSGGHTFATISASWFHTCGFSSSAVAYCWGSKEFVRSATA